MASTSAAAAWNNSAPADRSQGRGGRGVKVMRLQQELGLLTDGDITLHRTVTKQSTMLKFRRFLIVLSCSVNLSYCPSVCLLAALRKTTNRIFMKIDTVAKKMLHEHGTGTIKNACR